MLANSIKRKKLIETILGGLNLPKHTGKSNRMDYQLNEGINTPNNNSDFDVVYRGENILLIVPKTSAGACKYGAGTRWCAAQTDRPSGSWGTIEYSRQHAKDIAFFLLLYEDTPEGKVEKYKILIEKSISTGSENWRDMSNKKIFNLEMFRRFILTDPMVEQKINEYWKTSREQWRPKFKVGDYVRPKYGNWTIFKDKNGRGTVDVTWSNVVVIVVGETKNRLLVQVVRPTEAYVAAHNRNPNFTNGQLMTAMNNHWILQKWVNPYRFEKIG